MIRDCSICGVPIGYIFFHDREVYFDGSCGCCCGSPRLSSWEEVAEHYNRQTNECVIAQYDEFWHFNESQDKDSRPAEGTAQ